MDYLSSFLVVTIDIESLLTGLSDKKVDFATIAANLMIFFNSYSLMHRSNKLCVITYDSVGSHFIYPDMNSSKEEYIDFTASQVEISAKFIHQLKDSIEMYQKTEVKKSRSCLNSALSSALTIISSQQSRDRFHPRILNIQFDKDSKQDYNSIMNCIFSAQKLNVLIDSLVLSISDSHLMQQACYLTGGIYFKHGDWGDLLLVLQAYFLADNALRSNISLPVQKTIDFKAACFCHKKPVEFAYMCSVCLTLLCSIPSQSCPVCDTPLRKA